MDVIWLFAMMFAIAACVYDKKRLAISLTLFVGQGWFTLFLFDTPSDYLYYSGAIAASLVGALFLLYWRKYQIARSLFVISIAYAAWHIAGLWIYECGFNPLVYNHGCKLLLVAQILRMIWPTNADKLELRGMDNYNLGCLGHLIRGNALRSNKK